MGKIELETSILELQTETNKKFSWLLKLCKQFFGDPRIRGSHHIFKTPWKGDPRINLQKFGEDAKPYQVKQVRAALLKLQTKERE